MRLSCARPHKNIFGGSVTFGTPPPTHNQQNINPLDLFPISQNGFTFPFLLTNNTNYQITNRDNIINALVADNSIMKNVGVAYPRTIDNPLNTYLNGGKVSDWGGQFGANVYAYQDVIPAPTNVTTTDIGNQTVRVVWENVPTPDLFTKWGIYKCYFNGGAPTSNYDFLTRAFKVGEVDKSTSEFIDDGSVAVNSVAQNMYYRVRAEL